MKPDETGIATNLPPITSPYRSSHLYRQFQRQGPKSETHAEKAPELGVRPPSSERIMYNKIQGANTETHAVVQEIRSVDETMQQIGQNLDGMKQAVEIILKSYPPFPADSNERITRLRQFSALRKMIDQLTFPPKEEDSLAVILSDRQNQPASGDREYMPPPGSKKPVFHQQQVHPGEQGLNLPDLAMDASEDDLADAMERLTAASNILESKRKQFVADANRVITSIM